MSEDMNDKSSKKTSETSKSSTSKAEGSTSKSASSKAESTKAGTVETAAEQSSTSKGKGSDASSAAASGASSASSSGTASSGASQGSTQGSAEISTGNSGLPRHFAAGLSYVLGPITAVIFLLLDRADPFVRFHAAQSLAISAVIAVIWIGVAILNAVFAGMPLVFWLGLIGLLYMAFTAYQSKDWEVPIVGDYSQKIAEKVASEDDAK